MKKFIIIVVLVMALGGAAYYFLNTSHIKTEEMKIDKTATLITEIRKLGQWEFLTVRCEVMIDTVRPRPLFVTDDRLARIYTGSMRIGVDLGKTEEIKIVTQGDSIADITLPEIGLLDDKFIDEANTMAFYESGKWDGNAKEQMYVRAKQRMLAYGLSPQNIDIARSSARARFTALFSALGFKQVNVDFTK